MRIMLMMQLLFLLYFLVVTKSLSLFNGGFGMKFKTSSGNGKLKKIISLKEEINREAKGTANGVKASPEKRAKIQSLVNDLEKLNGEKR